MDDVLEEDMVVREECPFDSKKLLQVNNDIIAYTILANLTANRDKF